MEINGIVIVSAEQLSELINNATQAALKEFSKLNANSQIEEYLNTYEAAALIKVSTRTLIKLVREGKLKSGVTGRKYMFKKSELLKCTFRVK